MSHHKTYYNDDYDFESLAMGSELMEDSSSSPNSLSMLGNQHHDHDYRMGPSRTEVPMYSRSYPGHPMDSRPTPSATPSRHNHLSIIGAASHSLLLGSQNAAYLGLHEENSRLKKELADAKDHIISLLKEQSEKRNYQPLPPFSSTQSDTATHSITLNIPPCPPYYEKEEYPNHPFWTRDDWNNHIKRCRSEGEKCSKMGFLTVPGGYPITPNRISQIREYSSQLFATLHHARHDPGVWKSKTQTAADFYHNSMRKQFVEFRVCEGVWKVELFATIHYPDWKKTHSESGKLSRAEPPSDLKRKFDSKHDDNDIKPTIKSEQRVKRQKKTTEPIPSTATIIDLEASSSKTSSSQTVEVDSVTSPLSSTIKPTRTTPTTPPFTHPTTPAPTTHQAPTTLPPILPEAPATPAPIQSDLTGQNSETGQPPQIPIQSTLTPSAPLQTAPAPVQVTNFLPTQPPETLQTTQAAAMQPSLPSNLEPQTHSSDVDNMLPAQPTITTGRQTRRQRQDILSGMSIPAPPVDVVAAITTNTTDGLGAPVTSTNTALKKKGKLMEPNSSVTARNLFAIEYITVQGNQVTAAEFKAVYDSLDKAILKKYEALSREKKKEAANL